MAYAKIPTLAHPRRRPLERMCSRNRHSSVSGCDTDVGVSAAEAVAPDPPRPEKPTLGEDVYPLHLVLSCRSRFACRASH